MTQFHKPPTQGRKREIGMKTVEIEIKELKNLFELLKKYPEAKVTNLIGDKDVWRVKIQIGE